MPPRRKAKVSAAKAKAAPAQKRRAEDAPDARKDAPPAKKARQSAPKPAPKKSADVIEISSDSEGGSDDGDTKAIASKSIAASTEIDASDSDDDSDEGEDEDGANGANGSDSEDREDEDGNPRLPPKVRERLEYIESHTDGLTNTYLKFITRELNNFMGKGGDLACDIVNHCAFQAQLGRSDLGYEKRLVKRIHIMCWGGCGEEDDSDDEYDDDYEIPKEITARLFQCCEMLERFDLKALRKVIKNLPKYKGRRKGELDDVIEDVMAHIDDMAARKADIAAEVAMITNIQNKAMSRAAK